MQQSTVKQVALLISFAFLLAFAQDGFTKTTTDPNHQGWSGKHPKLKKVTWKPIKVKCNQCTKMAEQYNTSVAQLLESRYWVKFWTEVHANREKDKNSPFSGGSEGDFTEFEKKAIGANLELFELQKGQLDYHKARVIALEQQASYLRAMIAECEATACPSDRPTKIKEIKVGGEPISGGFRPDIKSILKTYEIDWQGPYYTTCYPCKKYALHLNALPGWVVRAHMKLQLAEAYYEYAKSVDKSNKIKVASLTYDHPDITVNKDAALKALEDAKKELENYKKYFEQLESQLKVCIEKFCPDTKIGMIEPKNCPRPEAHAAIIVGPNSEVGTSAQFKDKTKKKLVGAAAGALTGMLGLGGGGAKDPGPVTYKDPIKKKHKTTVKTEDPKRELHAGGAFTSDGLLISSDIIKAPNQGTFHKIYLENPRGWTLMPIAVYLYEIWREWKLTVSWTKDTYVDGQLVDHQEGGWSESWRELIARGEGTIFAEIYLRPIWEVLGFNTATSGARAVGTVFPVSQEMLENEPMNLVVHVTDPKKDPVVTVPYIFELSVDDKGKVNAELVDNTISHQKDPCEDEVVSIGSFE